jgi:hypothetical protein
MLKLKLKLIYDRLSLGQSVLVSVSRLDAMARFFLLFDDTKRQEKKENKIK